MIVGSLYPDYSTSYIPTGVKIAQFTGGSTPSQGNNAVSAYLMGFVDPETSGFNYKSIEVSGDTTTGQSLKLDSVKAKTGWFYGCHNSTLGPHGYRIYSNYAAQWLPAANISLPYLFNDIEMAKLTEYNDLGMYLEVMQDNPISGHENWSFITGSDYIGNGIWKSIAADKLEDWLDGSTKISITIDGDDYQLGITDFNADTNRFEIPGQGSHADKTLLIYIQSFWFTPSKTFYDGSEVNQYSPCMRIDKCLVFKVGDAYAYVSASSMEGTAQYASSNACIELSANGKGVKWLWAYNSGAPSGSGTYGAYTVDYWDRSDGKGYTGLAHPDIEIESDFFQWIFGLLNYNNYFIYKGLTFKYIGGSSSNPIFAIAQRWNINQIKTAWYLQNKQNTVQVAVNGYTYSIATAKFTPENKPTGTKMHGTDASLDQQLRIWQKLGHKITEDTFTEEDIPEGGGGDERPDPEGVPDKENSGDDIYRPDDLSVGSTLGFVTQYTMTATQITQLGQILWASFFEQDFWQNLLFSLTTTGSINVSEILNYFISLRVYPFSLVNIPGHTNMGQDMYIGTGFIPMHFTSDLFAINSYAAYIDAGKVKLPFYFGDFRDCKNIEITMYIPYCGTVQLEPADVLGGTISIEYAVDFATGACTAYADIDTWDGEHYQIAAINGQIGADVPLSGGSAAAIAARLGSDILNVAGILTAGAGGVAQGAMIAAAGDVGAGIGIAAASTLEVGLKGAEQAAQMATRPGIGAPALAGGRGFASFGSAQTAYIQIRFPKYEKPTNYSSTAANPAAKEVQISSCRGLCRFINPNVAAITANEEEKRQIRAALQTGIII